ncbi:MAG TPA: hypothetical protein PLQ88_24590, partial [Blastocatellia bacterium]|nr:hypothetical protein [Blastocatellia bacterium]
MKISLTAISVMLSALLVLSSAACGTQPETRLNQYSDLLQLFGEWRTFERPPLLDGAPDYTAEAFAKRHRDYQQLRQRLDAMDISRWPIPEQVDWHLVRAEMNGFDFNHRVLQPWVRDPAFY